MPTLQRPTAPGLIRDPDEIRAAMVQELADGGWIVSEGAANPAWRILTVAAVELALARQAISDAMAQTTLAFAAGAALDHIGETYRDTPRKNGESDDDYRARLRVAVGFRAIGLSGAWYEAVALGLEHVRVARAWSPAPGRVEIGVLADPEAVDEASQVLYPDGVPDAALRAAVLAAVTAPAVRQQTDTVAVIETGRLYYDVELDIQVSPHEGSELILATVRTRLDAALAGVEVLGGVIPHHVATSAAAGRGTVARLYVVADPDADAHEAVEVVWGGDSVAPLRRRVTVAVAISPEAPAAPAVADAGDGVVTVTWGEPAVTGGGIESYAVGVSPDGKSWTVTATVSSPASITAGVARGARSHVRVRALSLAGVIGPWSDQTQVDVA